MAGEYRSVNGLTTIEAAHRALIVAERESCELTLSSTGMKVVGAEKNPSAYLQELIVRAGPDLRELVKRQRSKQAQSPPPAGFTRKTVEGQVVLEKDGVSYPVGDDDDPTPSAQPVEREPKPNGDGERHTVRFKRVLAPYTMFPNVVFELPERLGLELSTQALLNQIIRRTFGFHYEETDVDMHVLCTSANMSYRTGIRAMEQLEEHRLVRRERSHNEKGHRNPDLIVLTLPGIGVE